MAAETQTKAIEPVFAREEVVNRLTRRALADEKALLESGSRCTAWRVEAFNSFEAQALGFQG